MPSVENLLGLTLQKCSHPIRLRDEKHGGFIFVPCQKCTNCIEAKRNTMARRLDLEAKGSVSCLFITLTYDSNHIPRPVHVS